MNIRFVCLANSFKEGGRCIAGIELDMNNGAIFFNGKPKWIRPVYDTEHGQIPNQIAEPFQILNIIELEVIAHKPNGYQSENIIFKMDSIKTVGNFNSEKLSGLCENINIIFSNKGKAVHEDAIRNLRHSLILVSTSKFEITQKMYEDNPEKPQVRLKFNYNDIFYDFPVTDPIFLYKYHKNNMLLQNVNQIYLTLSLGIAFKGWYYKLIAGIIY